MRRNKIFIKPLPKPKPKRDHTNRHHVIPSSRSGRSTIDNIVILDIDQHQHYHHVFENKDPVEIIEYLVSHFWHTLDGETGERFIFEWLDKYYEKN